MDFQIQSHQTASPTQNAARLFSVPFRGSCRPRCTGFSPQWHVLYALAELEFHGRLADTC